MLAPSQSLGRTVFRSKRQRGYASSSLQAPLNRHDAFHGFYRGWSASPAAQVCDVPGPKTGQVLQRVCACGVCRRDLHLGDGELQNPKYAVIPGHEIVGRILACGPGVEGIVPGQRVGVPWLGWNRGQCKYCRSGRENFCPEARFIGYQIAGGYAEQAVADARYCFTLPDRFSDIEAALLRCAGLIGYRTLRAGMVDSASELTALARPPISRYSSHSMRAETCTTSLGPVMLQHRFSPAPSLTAGSAGRMKCHPSNSMPRWFLRLLAHLWQVVRSCAVAFT